MISWVIGFWEPVRTIGFWEKPVFFRQVNPRVFLLKLVPGMRPEILEPIFREFDCIIVESFGVGGIPDSIAEEFFRQLRTGKLMLVNASKLKLFTFFARVPAIICPLNTICTPLQRSSC